MSRGVLGRALAIAGIVTGLLGAALPYVGGSRYVDDGTTATFLIVLLSLASWFPAEIGRDRLGATTGAVAAGFFLFVPAAAAFDSFGRLEAGAWLGLGALLIPVGALVAADASEDVHLHAGPGLLAATVGLVLVATGTAFHVGDGGPTYWSLSSSGHAIGLLTIALAAASAVLLGLAAHSSLPAAYPAVLVAAVTSGFALVGVVEAAFGGLGSLGAGAWLEGCGGILLFRGAVAPQVGRSSAPIASPAVP